MDDTTLVKGLSDSDPRATHEAWVRFGPLVNGMLRRALGNATDLEDLSQEVFITFFDRVKTLRESHTVLAFMMSITAYRIRTYLRSRRMGRWLSLSDEAIDRREVEQASDAREALLRFCNLLVELSPFARRAFALRHVEGMELRDVAAACDVSLATIKRRLTLISKRVALQAARDPVLVEFLGAPSAAPSSGIAPSISTDTSR